MESQSKTKYINNTQLNIKYNIDYAGTHSSPPREELTKEDLPVSQKLELKYGIYTFAFGHSCFGLDLWSLPKIKAL